MRMVEVVALPSWDLDDDKSWFAVIGPGRRIVALLNNSAAAEQWRSQLGLATHEVREVRFSDEHR